MVELIDNVSGGLYCRDNVAPVVESIFAQGNSIGVFLENTADLELSGLSLRENSRGLWIENSGVLLRESEVFANGNESLEEGGGIYAEGSAIVLSGVTVAFNEGYEAGSGIYA